MHNHSPAQNTVRYLTAICTAVIGEDMMSTSYTYTFLRSEEVSSTLANVYSSSLYVLKSPAVTRVAPKKTPGTVPSSSYTPETTNMRSSRAMTPMWGQLLTSVAIMQLPTSASTSGSESDICKMCIPIIVVLAQRPLLSSRLPSDYPALTKATASSL